MLDKHNDDEDEGQVPSVFKRKLDLAPTASKDVVSLNNVIVKMRPKIHASKRIVISKLREKIKRLKNMKKASEEEKEANEKKASDREKEIKVIKALLHDHVSKFAIGSTDKLEALFSKPGVSLEKIALVRLASHKYIQDVVQDFRKKHPDWKELGAYLMTKHTNREFKKKKTKPETLTSQMKQSKKMKTKANIEASETMVKSYLKEKLMNEDIESGAESDVEVENKTVVGDVRQSEAGENENEDSGNEGSANEEVDDDDGSDDDDVSDDDDDGDDDASGDNVDNEDDYDGDEFEVNESNLDDRVNSDGDFDSNSDISDNEGLNVYSGKNKEKKTSSKNDNKGITEKLSKFKSKSINKEEKLKTEKSSKKEKGAALDNKSIDKSKTIDKVKKKKETNEAKTDVEKKPPKPKTLEKSQGEIIVKKLNLDDWSFTEPSKDKIPEILLSKDEKNNSSDNKESDKPKKKSASDPFFDTGNRSFQSRDSKPSDLGKNLLAFAGYTIEEGVAKPADPATEVHEIETDSFSFKTNNDKHFVDDYDDIFNEKSRRDGSVYMKANNIGKQAFRTTFMESLNSSEGKEFSGRGKFNKDKHLDRDRLKGKGRQPKERDFDKMKVGASAGTKAMLKKKGMFQVRDSKQDDLGSNLLNIAGYDKDGPKPGSGSFETAGDTGLWEKKGDHSRGRKSDNPVVRSSQGSGAKPAKTQSMHPSWEASKKRKQQQSGIAEFSGKKIKFDD